MRRIGVNWGMRRSLFIIIIILKVIEKHITGAHLETKLILRCLIFSATICVFMISTRNVFI